MRLNYAGEFHLDILPACPNGGNGAIVVPDRKLACWVHSNPKGFAEWFFGKCQLRDELAERMLAKAVEPLPSAVPSEYKYTLQRVVQLMKRHRDVFFDGGRDIARSVILTTLAGHFYVGQRSLSVALDMILDGIHQAAEAVSGVPRIENPVHPDENFADTWDQARLERFKAYIRHFRTQMKQLLSPTLEKRGIEAASERLGNLFGTAETKEALRLEAQEVNKQRETKRLAVSTIGMLTAAASARATVVQPNQFFGR
jgi:hypothetical protein